MTQSESSTTFAAIGQKLRTAREARSLSLRQVCERTKIPINHLQALDDGNVEGLPEAVYVTGFIKRYAETVGLDGYALSDEFKRAAGEAASANGKNNGKSNGNGRYPKNQPVYVHPEYLNKARINTAPPTYKLWPFSIVLGVLVLCIFCFLAQRTNTTNDQDPAVLSLRDSASRATATSGLQSGQTQTMPATATATDAAPGADGTKIALSANQHVWVEVKAVSSGESLYTGYLEQGDRRDFSDSQGFRVRAGNGGNLSVDYKGKIETLGALGKVSERAFVTGSGPIADPNSTTAATTKTTSTAATAAVRTIRKPVSPKRSTPSYRSIPDSTRSIDSGGGSRSIDVPYRYDGRLDSD